MNICLLAANCCLRDESSILINLGTIAVLHNISLSHIFFLKLFLDILCSLYQNTLKSEVSSSRIAPFAFVLFCPVFEPNTSSCHCVCVLCRLCCQRRWLRWWSGPPSVQSSEWMEISFVALSRLLPETTLLLSCLQHCSHRDSVGSAGKKQEQ